MRSTLPKMAVMVKLENSSVCNLQPNSPRLTVALKRHYRFLIPHFCKQASTLCATFLGIAFLNLSISAPLKVNSLLNAVCRISSSKSNNRCADCCTPGSSEANPATNVAFVQSGLNSVWMAPCGKTVIWYFESSLRMTLAPFSAMNSVPRRPSTIMLISAERGCVWGFVSRGYLITEQERNLHEVC